MQLIRLKQHKFETTRNGHTIDKYEEYQIIAKPHRQEKEILDEFNVWLNSIDKEAYYKWNDEDKHQQGVGLEGYGCWCEMIGDWLLTSGWEYKGSDDWDRAEIWVRDNNKGGM